MSINIFRTATGQAIREIISDHSQENRFGRTLTDSDLDAICERVVDLFEMTLNLRAQVAGTGVATGDSNESSRNSGRQTSRSVRWDEEPTKVPTTRAASEIYDFGQLNKQSRADALPSLAPQQTTEIDLKLPRKRISVTVEEREVLMRRAQSPAVAPRPAP
ncbi:MAG: hypothetical protein FJY29_05690 [Betaproteobacteria bacterium]|nr:hypothetical protein [Betaproteobacteria bacterium]